LFQLITITRAIFPHHLCYAPLVASKQPSTPFLFFVAERQTVRLPLVFGSFTMRTAIAKKEWAMPLHETTINDLRAVFPALQQTAKTINNDHQIAPSLRTELCLPVQLC
jgi:hypothetical protein